MNRKTIAITLALAALAGVPASAQYIMRDFWGTALGWVLENLDPSAKQRINGITVDGCTWAPDGAVRNGRYISWRAACNQHDLDYANPLLSKEEADLRFYENMKRLAPLEIARLYYRYVQLHGQPYWEEAQGLR